MEVAIGVVVLKSVYVRRNTLKLLAFVLNCRPNKLLNALIRSLVDCS